ncbi:replication factor C large subunit [Naegleria gruberi]|uniref:Replication factor C subunit 1 n=1 Tax=Naegleria gruberi TaxID=5762 RepID=D2VBB2_NAEGR|nr:replication factor C large subunit [Naegleria gruberi]EFC45766.1 replication factor C large subunit [Naegleria gruberi]|eukprot:XP_002678510.1 replication factor C large subunit [Naegleria gruberi strain NEG-M]
MPPKPAPGTQKITSFFSVKKPTSSSTDKSPKKPSASSSNGNIENPNKRKRESVTLELSDDSDGCASPILTRSQRAEQVKSPSSSTPSKSTTSTTPTKSTPTKSSASKTTTSSTSSSSKSTKSTPTKSTVTLKKQPTSVKDEDWSDDERDFGKDKIVLNKATPTKSPVVAQKNTKIILDDDALSSQDVVSSPSTKKRKTSSPFTKSPRKVKEEEVEEKPKTTPKKEVKKEEKKKKNDDDDEEKPAETKKRNFYDKTQHQNQQKAKNHGCKTVPVGKANCLKDKSFVITGQMESLDRDEMEDLIKQYGGVIRGNVSGRTSFVVVGDGPGESKMKKVREHKTKQLSEDDLLEMIAKSNPSGKDSMDETDDDVSPPPQKFIPPSKPNSVGASTTQVIKSKNADDQLWVEKYKPSTSSQIIGHNKECGLLLNWLKEWHANLDKEIQAASTQTKGRKKAATEWKRAAFLSGPPGIGKSTSAALIAKEAGFTNIVELNASDSRSKKAMKEQIVESCLSNNISNYFQKKGQPKPKDDKQRTIVIMDEVDGMSSGDRGGVVELVQIIKQTRVPVICIANDRSKISLKTLITHCLDLKFSRPSKATITKKLLEVCKKENLSIDNNALEYMVESLNNDIRSVLNNLQLINRYSAKDHIGYLDAKSSDLTKTSSTDGIFDVVKDVLGQNSKKYNERLEDFYFDPMLVPLFVEQNYINIRPPGDDKERIQRISYASDSISMGDIVNSKIRKEMSFGLMNSHAFYSTMYPAYFIRGSFQALRGYDKYYQFPAVLGKGSTTTKNYNALKTIQKTTSLKASADTLEMLDYLPLLSKTLLNPLLGGDKDVQETIEAMDEYQISRDDLEFMCELSTFKGKNSSDQNKDWFSEIDTKTKTALTRQYNKAHKGFNKVSAAAALSKVEDEENPEAEEEDEEEDLKADKFVTKMKNIAKLEAFEKKREKAEKAEKKSTKKTTKKETTKKESTKKESTSKKEVKKETEKKPLVLKKK